VKATCEEFESMDWFAELVLYCSGDSPDNDPDLKLVSMVVERTILPKLTSELTTNNP
jgi:hypothetical protein